MENKKEKYQSGIIEQFTFNKHEDINGLTIMNNDGQLKFKFPSHIAKLVMDKVNPGELVELTYQQHDDQKQEERQVKPINHLINIKNLATGLSLVIAESTAPKPADSDEIFEFNVEHPEINKGNKEDITGITFDDKFIHLKPHVVHSIKAKLLKASFIKIKAKKRLENLGFVNIKGLKVYHAIAIEVVHQNNTVEAQRGLN